MTETSPPSAKLICETDESIAIYAPAADQRNCADAAPLVITFPSITTRGDGLRFWQSSQLARAGVSALGVMGKSPHWFTRQEMARLLPALLPIIARHRPGRIVTWGYSMGATPALMHGRSLGADLSLAQSPHFSVDPDIIGSFDPRRKRTFDPKLHTGFKIEENDLSPVPVLFYDPLYYWDREHARRIEALSPRVQRVVTTGTGHFSSPLFYVTDAASRAFVDLIAYGRLDTIPRTARNLLRSARHLSADYFQELSGTLVLHGRVDFGLRAARRAFEMQPQNARRRIHLAELQKSLTTDDPRHPAYATEATPPRSRGTEPSRTAA